MSGSRLAPFTQSRDGRKNSRPCTRAAAAGLAAALLLSALTGCKPRKLAAPAPTPTRTDAPTSQPTPSATPLPAPELRASIAPERIQPGESALLTWESRHASSVRIEPAIGPVDGSGQIRLFPDRTTAYRLRATGPGGSADAAVTIEVGGASEAPVSSEDIPPDPSLPLDERFKQAVKPVFFEFDRAELGLEAQRVLDGNAAWLTRPDNLEVRFIIQGHCDVRGTDEYNLALGDKRAQVVRNYLVSKGVDPIRIGTVSFGEERPFALGNTEEDHALNRRAHFVLVNR